MAFAIIFDSVGAGEWLVLLAVLLVVMGPKRLPSTARTIGSYYSKFRRAAENFKRQIMDMDYEMEREMEKARREAEAAMTIPDDPPEMSEGPDDMSYGGDEPHDEYPSGEDDPPAAGDGDPAALGGSAQAENPPGDDDGDKPAQKP